MNKFLVSCIVFCSVFLTSCIGPQGEQGERGPKGDPGVVGMKIVNVTVKADEWLYTNSTNEAGLPHNNNYFYATVDVPELTSDVYNLGNVKGYVIYDYNTPAEKQHELPYVRHYESLNASNTWEFYTETVDYVFGVGWVEFQFRASDFQYEENTTYNPNEHHFRIVITY